MNTATESIDEPRISVSTLRVRRHRERRREGLRLLTLEMPVPAIETAIARGFLKPEETTQAWSVIQSVYAAQLSDRAHVTPLHSPLGPYLSLTLSKVIRWETGEAGAFDRSLTPDEIMDRLEKRVGPEGRKLFERFLRQVNKLQVQQHLEAQALTDKGGR